jgi:hypothetical protein
MVGEQCILQKTLLKMQLIQRPYISSSSKSSWFKKHFKEKALYCFAPTNAALLNYQEQLNIIETKI